MAEIKIDLSAFVCPISRDIFKHPVVTNCGHTYEYSYITKWLESNKICPICATIVTSFSVNWIVVKALNLTIALPSWTDKYTLIGGLPLIGANKSDIEDICKILAKKWGLKLTDICFNFIKFDDRNISSEYAKIVFHARHLRNEKRECVCIMKIPRGDHTVDK